MTQVTLSSLFLKPVSKMDREQVVIEMPGWLKCRDKGSKGHGFDVWICKWSFHFTCTCNERSTYVNLFLLHFENHCAFTQLHIFIYPNLFDLKQKQHLYVAAEKIIKTRDESKFYLFSAMFFPTANLGRGDRDILVHFFLLPLKQPSF